MTVKGGATVQRESLNGGRTVRVRFTPLAFEDVLRLLRDDAPFRDAFLAEIREAPFDGLFWETPALTDATLGRPFEMILADAPALARARPDPAPFSAHLRGAGPDGIVVFPNLGGDAELVVPAPLGRHDAYPHLAAFVRAAPYAQAHALLERTAAAIEARRARDPSPCWVSTSGLGVSWVHVRLDATPKYYTHAPYRTAGR